MEIDNFKEILHQPSSAYFDALMQGFIVIDKWKQLHLLIYILHFGIGGFLLGDTILNFFPKLHQKSLIMISQKTEQKNSPLQYFQVHKKIISNLLLSFFILLIHGALFRRFGFHHLHKLASKVFNNDVYTWKKTLSLKIL